MGKRKPNKKGRNDTNADFVMIDRYLIRSAAWQSLKLPARAAYVEIAFCYTGSNNGSIQLSARMLAERLGVDKATASRAIAKLIENGFLVVTKKSAFSVKVKLSSEYRLTNYKCNVTGQLASKEFMRWTPKVQNTVAPLQPHGCTTATDSTKTTSHLSEQLQQCNPEPQKPPPDGCTSAPHLYLAIGESVEAGEPSSHQESTSLPLQPDSPQAKSSNLARLNNTKYLRRSASLGKAP